MTAGQGRLEGEVDGHEGDRRVERQGQRVQGGRHQENEPRGRPGVNLIKTFYGRNLQMFVISYSLRPWQAFVFVCENGQSLPE